MQRDVGFNDSSPYALLCHVDGGGDAANMISGFVLAGTMFAGDATNSGLLHQQKLQGLEVMTMALVNIKALSECRYDDAFVKLHMLPLPWLA